MSIKDEIYVWFTKKVMGVGLQIKHYVDSFVYYSQKKNINCSITARMALNWVAVIWELTT